MMYELAVVGVALADRFLLKRNAVTIEHTHQIDDQKVVRFTLSFRAKRAISSGVVTYSLRNKKRPAAVITKTRRLDFSVNNLNHEFLTFNKMKLEQEAGEDITGQWILDVKIERSCSRVNPLYKIFPTVTTHQEEFEIFSGHQAFSTEPTNHQEEF